MVENPNARSRREQLPSSVPSAPPTFDLTALDRLNELWDDLVASDRAPTGTDHGVDPDLAAIVRCLQESATPTTRPQLHPQDGSARRGPSLTTGAARATSAAVPIGFLPRVGQWSVLGYTVGIILIAALVGGVAALGGTFPSVDTFASTTALAQTVVPSHPAITRMATVTVSPGRLEDTTSPSLPPVSDAPTPAS